MSLMNHRLRGLLLATVGLVLIPTARCAAETPMAFPSDFVARLNHAKKIYVATERRSGARSKAVPVWFALVDGAIWFSTGPNSHKVRRVRRGSPMFVSVHGEAGPFVTTAAEISTDGAMAERLGEIYARKYWIAWLGFFRPSRARVESGKVVLLRLTPAP